MGQRQSSFKVKKKTLSLLGEFCWLTSLYTQQRLIPAYHDDFDPLHNWVGFLVFFLLQNLGELTQLPDWTADGVVIGKLYIQGL